MHILPTPFTLSLLVCLSLINSPSPGDARSHCLRAPRTRIGRRPRSLTFHRPNTALDLNDVQPPVLSPRGNGICYYILPQSPSSFFPSLGNSGRSEIFFLPAGTYAVSWIEQFRTGLAAEATSTLSNLHSPILPPFEFCFLLSFFLRLMIKIVFFKLYRYGTDGHWEFVQHLGSQGARFISDGITGMSLVLMQMRQGLPHQRAEVWVRAI